jgi:hypothetical protein
MLPIPTLPGIRGISFRLHSQPWKGVAKLVFPPMMSGPCTNRRSRLLGIAMSVHKGDLRQSLPTCTSSARLANPTGA